MRKSSYNNEKEISKEECNIQTENNEQLINNNQRYMEEYIEEEVKDNPYNESESSREFLLVIMIRPYLMIHFVQK